MSTFFELKHDLAAVLRQETGSRDRDRGYEMFLRRVYCGEVPVKIGFRNVLSPPILRVRRDGKLTPDQRSGLGWSVKNTKGDDLSKRLRHPAAKRREVTHRKSHTLPNPKARIMFSSALLALLPMLAAPALAQTAQSFAPAAACPLCTSPNYVGQSNGSLPVAPIVPGHGETDRSPCGYIIFTSFVLKRRSLRPFHYHLAREHRLLRCCR